MKRSVSRSNQTCVEIAERVFVQTPIPIENHPALRAGFGGYTANPRWCGSKFMAWRTGKAWRTALQEGQLAIRESDRMLVPFAEAHPPTHLSQGKGANLFERLRRRSIQFGEGRSMQQSQQIQPGQQVQQA